MDRSLAELMLEIRQVNATPAHRQNSLGMNFSLKTILLLGAFAAASTNGFSQDSLESFHLQQMATFYHALNDPTVAARVQKIWFQLANYSGQRFAVFPAQNYTAGQALPNGAILLDLSIAGDPSEEVTAFFLAHEWGHQVMHHPQIGFQLMQYGPYAMAVGGKAIEDAADQYGARFIKALGYSADPVVDFLRSIPNIAGDIHSTGNQRANAVLAVFSQNTSSGGGGASSAGHWAIVPCTHPAHPQGDLIPCQHGALHPSGDAVPCQHFVNTPWGPRPMHQYDIVPCQHPVHPMGDLVPCTHPAHPGGDRVWVSN